MDQIVGAVLKAIGEFWIWIAPAFWPALPLTLLTIIIPEHRRWRDRAEVTGRIQREEYTEWRKGLLSGDLTGAPPSDEDTDRYLRWFLVRKEDKPNKFLLSNRADSTAHSIRLRLETWPEGRTIRRRKIRPGKTIRLKIGPIPDRSINGVRLDIHWDDVTVLAQKVSFIIPQSESKLPRLDTSDKPQDVIPAAAEPVSAPAVPVVNAVSPVVDPVEDSSSHSQAIASVDSPAPLPNASAVGSTGVKGLPPSTNIADPTIPNRTPSLPADFVFVEREGSLGLMNQGPGDASHVYLQPVDDAHAIRGGGFWPSIPAHKVQPFALMDDRDRGMYKIRFELTWDDGYMLGRDKEMNIPGMGD